MSDVKSDSAQHSVGYGELIPMGGGDSIPLLKKNLLVGRRESCDIVLRFKNVSAHHCRLTVKAGYWYVRDLDSLNGVKVNDVSVSERRLDPGDLLAVAKHRYRIQYVPDELGAVGPPPPEESVEDIFGDSLLERAGLVKKGAKPGRSASQRIDVMDDSQNQLKGRSSTE